jgi:hypothetical protein
MEGESKSSLDASSPRVYSHLQDLGKSASDLLLKDYPIQGTSLEVKTLTPSNVTFKVAGMKDSTSNAINGDIEGKYVDFKNGLIFTQVCFRGKTSSGLS